MEAVGAVASVIAAVELVGKVSASATSFMRDVKDARRDMIQVRKDMSDLSTVLEMVAEDLENDLSPPDNMSRSQQHIVGITHSCCTVLLEIEMVISEGQSRLRWALSGKERVKKLRERLETCKLSLDVALDYRTMVVVHDIKKDSTQIRGDISAIQSNIMLLIAKVDNIARQASRSQNPLNGMGFANGGVMLDRFLTECRSDAQTVLDNIDYQDLENSRQQVQAETSGVKPTISLKNSFGYIWKFPLEDCTTWAQIEKIIRNTYSPHPEEIVKGRYTIYHKGQAIPPGSWADCVGRGKCFDIKLWNEGTIKFKDALGRKYDFPFILVRKWKGIKKLVEQAFPQVDGLEGLGFAVKMGYYSLLGPDDIGIPPEVWEQFIRPGMSITMKLWPLPGPVYPAITRAEGQQVKETPKMRPPDFVSKQTGWLPAPGRRSQQKESRIHDESDAKETTLSLGLLLKLAFLPQGRKV